MVMLFSHSNDPYLAHFAQADTIVPGGVQGYDRYAYVNNSPVRYNDPSGHANECSETVGGSCVFNKTSPGLNEGGGSDDNGENSNEYPKVSPHRLRHTCATQLLNAGCRITSIQRFLGHKSLNTTMIYAHAHNKTVAEDYFAAMERVEQEPGTTSKPREAVSQKLQQTALLGLIKRLEQPELSDEERREITAQLRRTLTKVRPGKG